MYFWRIKDLKARLQERPLTEREALSYLLVYLVLAAATTVFPMETMNSWDYIIALGVLVLTVAGTVYAYQCNGGANGSHFLQRYFAIGWVVAVRWAAAVVPLFIVLMAILGAPEDTNWHIALYFVIVGALFYQRLGHHMREVAVPTLRSHHTVETDARDPERGSS